MPNLEDFLVFKVNTDWTNFEVVDEPEVVLTVKGYTPILIVKAGNTDIKSKLYIAPKSLAEKLDPLRKQNGDKFKGLKFKLRKESLEKFAKYELEKI